jgi:phage replication-related protein YjqB (UPF0714/DUF867 family)
MSDKYSNFAELAENEEGNYTIECIDRSSTIVIVAPHGGKIETHTTDIAKSIADNEYSFYSFVGQKQMNNRYLHITSHNFDEPKCLELIGKSNVVVTIHGCKDITTNQKEIFIGGLNKELRKKFIDFLQVKDFSISIIDKFKGELHDNICNRGLIKKGIQFELTESFRNDKELRERFIEVVREFLQID